LLGWQPRWHIDEAVTRTVGWYRDYYRDPARSMRDRSIADIEAFEAADRSPEPS